MPLRLTNCLVVWIIGVIYTIRNTDIDSLILQVIFNALFVKGTHGIILQAMRIILIDRDIDTIEIIIVCRMLLYLMVRVSISVFCW